MTEWAAKWGGALQLNGTVGFGRECVGILLGSAYLDYSHIYDLEPQPEFWAPEDSYHKHDCVAVLGHGDDSIDQLYEWVKWLDGHGWTVEEVSRQPSHALDAIFNGLSTPRLMPPAEPVDLPVPEPIDYKAEVERLRARVAELEEDSQILNKLRAAGVDNWDGYEIALSGEYDD